MSESYSFDGKTFARSFGHCWAYMSQQDVDEMDEGFIQIHQRLDALHIRHQIDAAGDLYVLSGDPECGITLAKMAREALVSVPLLGTLT